MKKCPICKRTYSDDTLSFCLEDGTLLSAAYDPEDTLVLGADDPTVQRTNPHYKPETPTETRFAQPRETVSSIRDRSSSKTFPHLIYAGAGLVAVLAIVGGMVWMNGSNRATGNESSTGAPPPTNTNVASRVTTPIPIPRQTSKDVSVDAQFMWTDTFLDVRVDDKISITASGQVNASTSPGDAANKYVGPDGWGYQPTFSVNGKPARWLQVLGPGSSLECLTGKIGDQGSPFKVGSSYSFTVTESGRLFLGVNHVVSDSDGIRRWQNNERGRIWTGSDGSFEAHVEINGSQQTTVPKRTNNVPTARELQDALLKEAKRIEDEANRR